MKRKMGFVVDKVSEDSFYENLLLGLSKILEQLPCVSNLSLKRFTGVKQMDIRSWEHNNGVVLPEDIRAFYASTNGFLYTYDFSYDYASSDSNLIRQGKIEMNPINDLVRTYGYETKNAAQIEQLGKKFRLSLSPDSKIFELSTIDENAKVVLVYINSYSTPSVWLYSTPMSFNYLAEDFTVYFRMCIAHLGIPCWQYAVSKEGVPEWTREIFQILAPGVLREDQNLIEIPKFDLDNVNKIDPNIFVTHSSSNSSTIERTSTLQTIQQNKNKDKKGKSAPKRHSSGKIGKKLLNEN